MLVSYMKISNFEIYIWNYKKNWNDDFFYRKYIYLNTLKTTLAIRSNLTPMAIFVKFLTIWCLKWPFLGSRFLTFTQSFLKIRCQELHFDIWFAYFVPILKFGQNGNFWHSIWPLWPNCKKIWPIFFLNIDCNHILNLLVEFETIRST